MADQPDHPLRPAPDPKAKIMVELLEAGALLLVLEEQYLENSTGVTLPYQALGPLRLRLNSAPDWGPESRVYRVWFRREEAEALRQFCAEAAEVLKGFPEQPDRDHGGVLETAARAFTDALRLSTTEPS